MIISITFLLTCTCITAAIICGDNWLECFNLDLDKENKSEIYWGWATTISFVSFLFFGGMFLGALLQEYFNYY